MSSPAPRQLISGARHAYLALEPKPHACVSERRKERLRDGGGRCCREREEAARRSVWNLPRRVELNYGLEMCLVAPHGALVSQHALHSPREVPGKGSRRLLFRKVFQAFSMLCALASFPPTCRLVCDPPARYSGHQDHSVPSSPSFCNVCLHACTGVLLQAQEASPSSSPRVPDRGLTARSVFFASSAGGTQFPFPSPPSVGRPPWALGLRTMPQRARRFSAASLLCAAAAPPPSPVGVGHSLAGLTGWRHSQSQRPRGNRRPIFQLGGPDPTWQKKKRQSLGVSEGPPKIQPVALPIVGCWRRRRRRRRLHHNRRRRPRRRTRHSPGLPRSALWLRRSVDAGAPPSALASQGALLCQWRHFSAGQWRLGANVAWGALRAGIRGPPPLTGPTVSR